MCSLGWWIGGPTGSCGGDGWAGAGRKLPSSDFHLRNFTHVHSTEGLFTLKRGISARERVVGAVVILLQAILLLMFFSLLYDTLGLVVRVAFRWGSSSYMDQ